MTRCATSSDHQHVAIAAIRFDEAVQVRASVVLATVNDYAERMEAGDRFPPVHLFKDGDDFYIGDGWHRLMAAKSNGDVTFPAIVEPGDKLAALKYALGANREHGLRRTNEDKRRAVQVALKHFAGISDRQIAELCGVSHPFVAAVRPHIDVETVSTSPTRTDSIGRQQPKKRHPRQSGPAVPGVAPKTVQIPGITVAAQPVAVARGMSVATEAIALLETVDVGDGEYLSAISKIFIWADDRMKENLANFKSHRDEPERIDNPASVRGKAAS